MCEICHRMICPPSCPNAEDDREIVHVCSKCGYKVREGDFAYKISESIIWCENCMQDAEFMAQ
jgi:hypothetical protein